MDAVDLPEQPAESRIAVEAVEAAELPPLSRDKVAERSLTLGVGIAIFLHLLVVAAFLLGALMMESPAEPTPIPVEFVSLPPPPPPKAPEQPPAQAEKAPPAAPDKMRRSGGEADKPPDEAASSETKPTESKTLPESGSPDEATPAAELPHPPTPPVPPDRTEAPAPPKPQHPPKAPARTASLDKAERAPEVKSSSNLGNGGGDRYLNLLRDDILSNRSYPPEIRSIGLSGTADYVMLIDRTGRLIDVKLMHSSGVDVLDHAGLMMIKRTAPFPPFPDDIKSSEMELTVKLRMEP